MDDKLSDMDQDSDLIFYPTNKVVGIIDDPGDCKAALKDLRAAGFTAAEIEVLSGKEDARRLDPTGEEHGHWHVLRVGSRKQVTWKQNMLDGTNRRCWQVISALESALKSRKHVRKYERY